MTSGSIVPMAWGMAICAGLMSGIYLVFSSVIMQSLAMLSPSNGIDAMNTINRVIVKTAFMLLFFGSTVLAVLMVLAGAWFWGQPGAGATCIAGLIYFIGMFVVTAVVNVPLNNALASVERDSEEAIRFWNHYLVRWTRWNSVRAAASGVTLVICLNVLTQ